MSYALIEPKIKPLTDIFNSVGFITHASCQGHGPLINACTYPYVAFHSHNHASVATFARLLREDTFREQPTLSFAWEIQMYFNSEFRIDYRLTMLGAYSYLSRFSSQRLCADFEKISKIIMHCATTHDLISTSNYIGTQHFDN